MKVAILKYNAGNVLSVAHALNRFGIEPLLTDNPDELRTADRIIFPGVGEASTAMRYLRERGLDLLFNEFRQPVLGICLGLQLMCSYSEENHTTCLGIFPNTVRMFPPDLKVPHMGWNTLNEPRSALLTGIEPDSYVYFVHSYYADLSDHTIARCDYSAAFSAGLHRDNFYALQFHPEKSGETGARILKNFLEI